jgi:hypothetical protein
MLHVHKHCKYFNVNDQEYSALVRQILYLNNNHAGYGQYKI